MQLGLSGPAHVQAASSALAWRRGHILYVGFTFIVGEFPGFIREELVQEALHLFDDFRAVFDRVFLLLEPDRLVEGVADFFRLVVFRSFGVEGKLSDLAMLH